MSFTQIEVTTVCNFDCLYCTGRKMQQKSMSWDTFLQVCEKINTKVVSLQGEGEPTLWPHFSRAVNYLTDKGFLVTTITNGSTTRHIELIDKLHALYVSIDSLDEKEASKIGRYNLAKVLTNLQALKPHSKKVTVTTVDYGQDLKPLESYCKSHGFKWQSQKLQQKQDYTEVYPVHWIKPPKQLISKKLRCEYLDKKLLDFYNIDGLHRPCCFIKSTHVCDPLDMQRKLNVGIVPHSCLGCSKIEGV